MFDIGFSELVLISIVGLVVLGPQRMPIAIRTVMKWVRTIRGLAANVQNELSQELKLQELQESIKKAEHLNLQSLSPELAKTVDELKQSAQKMKADLDKQAAETNQSIKEQIKQVREANFEQPKPSAEVQSAVQNLAEIESTQNAESLSEDIQAEMDLDAELAEYIEQYHPDDDIQPSTHSNQNS